jgi:hypothetical protein
VHCEIKRVERLNLPAALRQSARDAGECVPVVVHRPRRMPWVVTVALHDLPRLVDRLAPIIRHDKAP